MLWQHAFLETRWRFLIGLVILSVSAAFIALGYPQVLALSQTVTPAPDTSLGREIATARQAREISKIGVFYDTVEGSLEANGFAPNRNGGNQGYLRKVA